MQVSRPELPGSVRSAVMLMWFGASLTVLSTLIFIATKSQLVDSLADSHPSLDRSTVERAVERLQGRELLRTVVGVGLWGWMAIKNGEGRRWARVVGTIFGAINLIGIALTYALVASNSGDIDNLTDYTWPYLVLAGVMMILVVVILIQLYRPDSSRYFDETARWQAARTLRGY